MSEHCERCRTLEGHVFELWTALFPRETWVDAEGALRFMRVEYESLTEGNRARIDVLEADLRDTEKRVAVGQRELMAALGPLYQMVAHLFKPSKADKKIRENLRRPSEIQRAHDAVHISVSDLRVRDVVFEGDVPAFEAAIANLDALCWVLGHNHNDTFAKNLLLLDESLRKCGYELIDSGDLHQPGEEAE